MTASRFRRAPLGAGALLVIVVVAALCLRSRIVEGAPVASTRLAAARLDERSGETSDLAQARYIGEARPRASVPSAEASPSGKPATSEKMSGTAESAPVDKTSPFGKTAPPDKGSPSGESAPADKTSPSGKTSPPAERPAPGAQAPAFLPAPGAWFPRSEGLYVPPYYDAFKGLDLGELTPLQKERFLHWVNTEYCTCAQTGCRKDTIANCYTNDTACPRAPVRIREILDKVKQGAPVPGSSQSSTQPQPRP